ncbi:MAG: sugar ABC transporter ATP-binding protein, partial [Burkholderiales bacterium]|nr:sugar ABC transporter ATP-binding protein [Burkholderiales bacterium]
MSETAPATSLAAAPAGPVLELHGISKTFAGVGVLHGVELAVHPGQVMGLVGENGAGKSTLMRIVTGIYGADSGGVIRFGGREVHFASARQSIDAGVAMIHQDLNLLPDLTVAENLL